MSLHPIMEQALAPFTAGMTKAVTPDLYRDFEISTHDWAGWQAIHVDYDGPEDNRAFTGKTRAEVVEAIDEWWEDETDKLIARLNDKAANRPAYVDVFVKAGDLQDLIAEVDRLRAPLQAGCR